MQFQLFDAALQGDRTGLENHKPSGRCRRIAILVAAPRRNGTASRFDRGVDDRDTAAGGQSIEVVPSDLLGHLQPGPALVAIFHALAGIENEHRGYRSIAGGPRDGLVTSAPTRGPYQAPAHNPSNSTTSTPKPPRSSVR